MTIENRVKAEFLLDGIRPNPKQLWEAVCAAICEDGDRRRREERKQP